MQDINTLLWNLMMVIFFWMFRGKKKPPRK